MKPKAQFNGARILEDAALKGWTVNELSKRAKLADATTAKFLDGRVQTAKSAHKLAAALGHSVRRYFVGVVAA